MNIVFDTILGVLSERQRQRDWQDWVGEVEGALSEGLQDVVFAPRRSTTQSDRIAGVISRGGCSCFVRMDEPIMDHGKYMGIWMTYDQMRMRTYLLSYDRSAHWVFDLGDDVHQYGAYITMLMDDTLGEMEIIHEDDRIAKWTMLEPGIRL